MRRLNGSRGTGNLDTMPDGCNATEMLPEKALQKTENVCRNIDACSMSIKPTVTECNSIEIQSNIYDRLNSDKCREETDSCANTPRHQLYSARSHSDADAGIETVHDRKGLYDEDVGYEDSVDLRNRPTISLGELNEGIDLEELLYGPIHDAKVETPQLSATTIDSYRFEQPRPFWHLFNAIKSNDIYKQSEDWGIDRSIHTTYARAGFFADCHNADSVHHGDYLTVPDCDEFAECRIPLVVCIISTSREIRVNEVQKGIVPLAVNILDRYMVQHKTSMSRLVSIACAHMDSGSSVNSSKHGSLSSSLNANDISALNVSNVAKELKQKYKHDNLIKLCFKFLSDDAFGSRMSKREYGMKPYNDDSADVDSCYEETSDSEDPIAEYQYGSTLKPSIVYNLIAAACLFIADRYNGLSNTSVKALLVTWEAVSHAFTKTRVAAKYIRENRSTALSIIMSFMFDIYFVLDYKLTTPFPCHMVQDIIVSNADFKCPQRPWEYNLYQKLGAILARIAYLDDSFHRFRPSIVTLAIYSIVRRLAIHNKAVEDKDAWLLVDETDGEIRSCSDLLISTVLQYVNTDILDVLAQPVYMKHKTDELFSYIFDDLCDLNAKTLRNMANTLTSLK